MTDVDDLVLVRLTDRKIETSGRELLELERTIGAELPIGYDAFLLRHGDSVVSGVLHVLPPSEVLDRRSRMHELAERATVPFDVEASMPVAETTDAGLVVFDRRDPSRLSFLACDGTVLEVPGASMLELLAWFVASGEPCPATELAWVVPSLGMRRREALPGPGSADVEYEEVAESIESLALHEHMVEYEDPEGPSAVFLAPSIGGLVTVDGRSSPPRIVIEDDPGVGGRALARVESLVRNYGYRFG